VLTKELVAASTEPLVLGLLSQGENYGYALIQRVAELSGDKIEWSEGMLYPVLHRMESAGLVESEWKQGEAGRRRKYYRLAESGRKALREEKARWAVVNSTLGKLWNPNPASA
jgi:PadR family transcriptional regulator, regulatory protein PadR